MTKKLEETFNINPEEDEISETETTEEEVAEVDTTVEV